MWRANNFLLQDPTYAPFFSLKSNSGEDPTPVWNAHKAVIRGAFIQIGSQAKKKRMQQLDKLTADISASESINKTNPLPSLQAQIFSL